VSIFGCPRQLRKSKFKSKELFVVEFFQFKLSLQQLFDVLFLIIQKMMCEELLYHHFNIEIADKESIELKDDCVIAIQDKAEIKVFALRRKIFVETKMNQISDCKRYIRYKFIFRLWQFLKEFHIIFTEFSFVERLQFFLNEYVHSLRKTSA